MPGDTKIKRTANGWVDIDDSSRAYSARRLARDARRFRLQGRYAALAALPTPSTPAPQPSIDQNLSGLQSRLFKRLTVHQGVSEADALFVIKNNGYNKAASYGHMRAAGANHSEAVMVIDLDQPDVSLSYGIARSAGEGHSAALTKALLSDYDD